MVSVEKRRAAQRRRRVNVLKVTLRELRGELAQLNHQLGSRLKLRDVDIECLDLVNRHGPLSPSALASQAGLHPATLTGILDRLERGGWVSRGRSPDAVDRRSVGIRASADRNKELLGLLAGMNTAMDEVCAGYSDAELDVITDFLRRTAAAGRDSAGALAGA